MDCGSIGPDSSSSSDFPTLVATSGRETRIPRYNGKPKGPVIYGEEVGKEPFNRDAFYGIRGRGGYGVVVVAGGFIEAMAEGCGLSPDDTMQRIMRDVGKVNLGVVEYSPVGTPMLNGRRTRERITLKLHGMDRKMVVARVVPDYLPMSGDGGVM
ncbi:MAG: hypothetical protein HY362_01515 [Candidatus Aenigmarchaeota archaeon]|nr:hypothetical protein [Candidatus Aenigmarchaeota archaeon]